MRQAGGADRCIEAAPFTIDRRAAMPNRMLSNMDLLGFTKTSGLPPAQNDSIYLQLASVPERIGKGEKLKRQKVILLLMSPCSGCLRVCLLLPFLLRTRSKTPLAFIETLEKPHVFPAIPTRKLSPFDCLFATLLSSPVLPTMVAFTGVQPSNISTAPSDQAWPQPQPQLQ